MAQYQHPVNVDECKHGKASEYCPVVLIPILHLRPRQVDELDSLSSDGHQMISKLVFINNFNVCILPFVHQILSEFKW